MKITFWGGAREVTGSMHLIEVGGKRILLDCGLFEGRRQEATERNRVLPFDPAQVDCLILSHAHIDHSGNIPTLCKGGFEGTIYSTHATRDLCGILLLDSAHIQADDAEYLNRKNRNKGTPHIEPLYTKEEAEKSLRQFISVGYDRTVPILKGVELTFRDAGHILGSAIVALQIKEGRRKIRFGFTGDIGRETMSLLRARTPVTDLDLLVMESTYGDRLHGPIEDTENKLAEAVNRTSARGGKIIVPAFSVGSTQQVIHSLHRLIESRRIPTLPVYVDSPLSVSATEIFRLHPECYNDELYGYIMSSPNPFGFEMCRYVRMADDSKKLNDLKGPCVIISSSGMCEAGRILHHLKNNVSDPRNTILVVNFCAEHTLGKRIVERVPQIRIFGEMYALRAEVVVINAFSSHADRDELLSYVGAAKGTIRRYALVHGEEDQSLALAQKVREMTKKEVVVPGRGESVEI
ncbi:MAG: MBL fold metallo-hydrolase [Candidatus Aureabacteria bacterium]|nr:MBL fold metallo-hydrolase [Candidatus Auribacterota bacterium]